MCGGFVFMRDLFGNDNDVHFENLPIELQGLDLKPDKFEKLSFEKEVAMEHIIICFKKGQEKEVCDLLHLPLINTRAKSRYTLDEIKGFEKNGLL